MEILNRLRKQLSGKKSVGLLVDGPNMIRKEFNIDLGEVRMKAKKYGNLKIGKVFLNQYAKEKLIEAIASQGFEPVMSVSEDVDLDMAVEAMEIVHNPMIDIIILATRDSDYLPVVRTAKEHGKEVAIFGVDVGFSIALKNAADFVEMLQTK